MQVNVLSIGYHGPSTWLDTAFQLFFLLIHVINFRGIPSLQCRGVHSASMRTCEKDYLPINTQCAFKSTAPFSFSNNYRINIPFSLVCCFAKKGLVRMTTTIFFLSCMMSYLLIRKIGEVLNRASTTVCSTCLCLSCIVFASQNFFFLSFTIECRE